MERKRSRLEVIRDILIVIRDKNGRVKPTQILYKSNLSHAMMKEYLTDLIKKGLIKEMKTKDGRTYAITEKGNNYVEEYRTIVNFLDSFGLNEEEI